MKHYDQQGEAQGNNEKWPDNNPLLRQQAEKGRIHKVFITNEAGIFATYNLLISSLKEETNDDLTFIYITSTQTTTPLYKRELENLEKRFPGRLLLYTEEGNQTEKRDSEPIKQELLEVVINSNTKPEIQFVVNGEDEFTETTYRCLIFLGINPNQIIQQTK